MHPNKIFLFDAVQPRYPDVAPQHRFRHRRFYQLHQCDRNNLYGHVAAETVHRTEPGLVAKDKGIVEGKCLSSSVLQFQIEDVNIRRHLFLCNIEKINVGIGISNQ